MTSAKKITEHGDIPDIRDYMQSQNVAAGAETFAAAMHESRREIMSFIAKRLKRTVRRSAKSRLRQLGRCH